jgi:1,4-alpha-glucan branching enzyme
MAPVARPIGDLDLHLFGEGTHRRLWELLGPQPLTIDDTGTARAIRFALWAPAAVGVAVVGDWSDGTPEPLHPLAPNGPTGIWTAVVPAARSGHRYRFVVTQLDGSETDVSDPLARQVEAGWSVVPTIGRHDWHDQRWMGERGATRAGTAPLRIYELDLTAWRRGLDSWDDLVAPLAEHVERLGFTHVQFRPVGDPDTAPYAPPAQLGDPDDLRRAVDELHRRGIGVVVDWLPQRPPVEGWDLGRNEVRNVLVATALFWLDQYHVDGVRIGAVGDPDDPDVAALLGDLGRVVTEEFSDALVIADTPLPVVGATHDVDRRWASETLAYLHHDPIHRRHHHHDLVATIAGSSAARVLPLGDDDGDVSLLGRMAGDDWQRFAAVRTLLAWQAAIPGAPLLFMGCEIAPWEPRDPRAALPWHLLEHAPHRGVHDLVATLNGAARRWPALWRRDADPTGLQWLDADDADHSLYAFARWDVEGRSAIVAIANFTPVPRPGYRVGLPWGGPWEVVVDTDDARWWGSGHRGEDRRSIVGVDEPWQALGSSAMLDVGPMSMIWLGSNAPG